MAKSLDVRAVLIDMDGTAVDSNEIVEQSWAEVAAEFGLDLDVVLAFSHGRPGTETFQKFVPTMSAEEVAERNRAMLVREHDLAPLVKPIAGAPAFLESLDALGVPWALVTSAPRSLAQKRFKYAGLPWPEANVPVDDIEVGKPHPEGYLRAAELLGVDPKECVVFEDAPAGIRAGLASGAKVVVVDPSGPLDPQRLGAEQYLEENVVAQVPDLASVRIEPATEAGLFRMTW